MDRLKLLNYRLNKNEDGTYSCSYDFLDNDGKIFHVDAPKVQLLYEMEPLIGQPNVLFPNIRGHVIL